MTATVYPAYGLARIVVSRWYALAAAGAATAVPAFAYSPILVEEPLAYPLATLGALADRARSRATRAGDALAAAAGSVRDSRLTRTQLASSSASSYSALLWLAWESEPVRRWRASWTRLGLGRRRSTLAVGPPRWRFRRCMGHLSTSWRETTLFFKDRIFEHATWAVGALGDRDRRHPADRRQWPRSPGRRASHATPRRARSSSPARLARFFALVRGHQGRVRLTVFATHVYERNVIYLAPLLFAGTALALTPGVGRAGRSPGGNGHPLRRPSPPDRARATRTTRPTALRSSRSPTASSAGPTRRSRRLPSSSYRSSRSPSWSRFGSSRRESAAFGLVAAVAAVVVVTWSLTTQVYAAEASETFSRQVERNLPKPYDWVEQATGGGLVVVLGQQISDPTNVWLHGVLQPVRPKDVEPRRHGNQRRRPRSSPRTWTPPTGPAPPPGTDFALPRERRSARRHHLSRSAERRLYRVEGGHISWRTPSSAASPTDGSWPRTATGSRGLLHPLRRVARRTGFAVVKLSRAAGVRDPASRRTGESLPLVSAR